ncbi:MAG: GNAT family N-acetyltransferase [Chloroflexi bacterium]|nr:GNAT family N-acetyltransferase [Chloroflexota bacterium]MCL5275420.1 GNAT family N-acetyltransferase [Chloroflexota bacterium]
MKTTIYTTPDVFDALGGEWNHLLQRSATNTIFLTREWQKVWWNSLGDGELRVLAMRDDNGVLLGIAPLFFYASSPDPVEVAFVGCREVSDYLDFIFAREHELACFQAVADYLAGTDCPPWDHVSLCNIPEPSPTLTLLPEVAQGRGWHSIKQFEDVAPAIMLPTSFDAYMAMLDGKERRELQRKLRRAGGAVNITYTQDAATLDRDTDDFLRLMVASMPSKADFMTPRMARFFHAAARAMFDAGWLQLSFLDVDGERAATYLNFIYDNSVLVYNSGLDPLRFAHLSPGQVLLGRLIEKAIEEKRRVFDFLQGNEAYKYKLGGKDLSLYTLYIARK